jgi:serine protease AprX
VALLISANPSLAGDVDSIETILQETAVPRTTTEGCGSDTPTSVPNHVYGYGRIDALTYILQQFTHKVYLPLSITE